MTVDATMTEANGSHAAAEEEQNQNSLLVPVPGSDEAVEISLSSLPQDSEEVLDVLRAENAPLKLWRDVARAYMAEGMVRQFLHVTKEGTSDDAAAHFGPASGRERALLSLAAAGFHLAAARAAPLPRMRAMGLDECSKALAAARRACPGEQLVAVGEGQLAAARGDAAGARLAFERGAAVAAAASASAAGGGGGASQKTSVAAALAAGAHCLACGDAPAALQHYATALRLAPEIGSLNPSTTTTTTVAATTTLDPRLGIGTALFRLGNREAARLAWSRALSLSLSRGDGDCPCALLGLAALDLGSEDAEERAKGAERLRRAFDASGGRSPVILALLGRCCLAGSSSNGEEESLKARRAAALGGSALAAAERAVLRSSGATAAVTAGVAASGSGGAAALAAAAAAAAAAASASATATTGAGGAAAAATAATTATNNNNNNPSVAAASVLAAAASLAGRARHAAGDAAGAIAAYRAATEAAGSRGATPLPLLGMAQLALFNPYAASGSIISNATNAITLLERALEQQPAWRDALHILAPLYRTPEGRKRAPGGGIVGAGTDAASSALEHFEAAAAAPGATSEDLEAFGELLLRRGGAGGAGGGGDAARAATALKAAIDAARRERSSSSSPLPARLLNNAAVAQFAVGNAAGAAALLEEALASASAVASGNASSTNAADERNAAAEAVTLGFNRARVMEATLGPHAAAKEYAAIARAFPGYAECHVRLAALAAARGDMKAARESVEAAVAAADAPSGSPAAAALAASAIAVAADALAVLGRAHLERGEWQEARDAFGRLKALVKERKVGSGGGNDNGAENGDDFAELGIAAVALHSAPSAAAAGLVSGSNRQSALLSLATSSSSPASAAAAQRRERHLSKAMEGFKRVLQRSPRNGLAACGVGAVLAERGTALAAARDAFVAVREASAAFSSTAAAAPGGGGGGLVVPDATANLAAAHLALNQPQAAARLYDAAMRPKSVTVSSAAAGNGGKQLAAAAPSSSTTVVIVVPAADAASKLRLPLARALYDAWDLKAARRALIFALRDSPGGQATPPLLFDVALTLQNAAVANLKKNRPAGDATRLPECEAAARALALAGSIFARLKAQTEVRLLARKVAMAAPSGNSKEAAANLPAAVLDPTKLGIHVDFCAESAARATALLADARAEAAAVDARRAQSRAALEADAARRAVEAGRAAEAKAAAKREREARARRAAEKLARLRGEWAEADKLKAAAEAGDAAAFDDARRAEQADGVFEGEGAGGGDYAPGGKKKGKGGKGKGKAAKGAWRGRGRPKKTKVGAAGDDEDEERRSSPSSSDVSSDTSSSSDDEDGGDTAMEAEGGGGAAAAGPSDAPAAAAAAVAADAAEAAAAAAAAAAAPKKRKGGELSSDDEGDVDKEASAAKRPRGAVLDDDDDEEEEAAPAAAAEAPDAAELFGESDSE